jgi:hypothetical protein
VTKIFISYRRSDGTDLMAGRIRDRLSSIVGAENVFFDVKSIPIGLDFRKVMANEIGSADVVLAMIGSTFISERLTDPDDYVRTEIATALQRGVHVVPVLVEGARMPAATELPHDLAELAYRNAHPVRHDPDFDNDMEALVRLAGVTEPLRPTSARATSSGWSVRPRWLLPAASAAAAAAVVGGLMLSFGRDASRQASATSTAVPTALQTTTLTAAAPLVTAQSATTPTTVSATPSPTSMPGATSIAAGDVEPAVPAVSDSAVAAPPSARRAASSSIAADTPPSDVAAAPITEAPVVPATNATTVATTPPPPTTTTQAPAPVLKVGPITVAATSPGRYQFIALSASRCAMSRWTLSGPITMAHPTDGWSDPDGSPFATSGCWNDSHAFDMSWYPNSPNLTPGTYRITLQLLHKASGASASDSVTFTVP